MTISKPTIQEIKDRQVNDLKVALNSPEFLDGSFAKAISDAQSGGMFSIYGLLQRLSEIVLPDQAVGEFLNRWSAIWKISRIAATYASGNITFTGTDTTVIPSGTQFISDDDITYKTTIQGTISSGSATVAAIALAPGSKGNKAAAVTMTMLSPIAGVDSTVTVANGGLTAGADQESDESLLARLLQRIQSPPHGGSQDDYETWGLAISGVGKIWVFPNAGGNGTVHVFAVTNDEANLIPDGAKITEIQTYIDDKNRRPVTANVTVFAPTAVTRDFTIRVTPATDEIKAAVEANLKQLLIRDREPGGKLLISRVREAVSTAAGETDNEVVSPSADVQYSTGEIPVFGTITWQS